MSDAEASLRPADPGWAAAEEAAARHREERLHPSPGRRRLDRVLGPVVVAVWVGAAVAALVGAREPAGADSAAQAVSSAGLVLYLVLAAWWAVGTGRLVLRGGATSIRTAIPRTSQRAVGRQLALRQPLDPQHADVVVELARQGRRRVAGQAAVVGLLLLVDLGSVPSLHTGFGWAVLIAGSVALLALVVAGVVSARRSTRLIRQHEDGTGPGPSR